MSAAEWLTNAGYGVWIPLCHSPDVDLIAQDGDDLLRIQVKTCTRRTDNDRYEVAVCTRGGNRSWSGLTKRLDPARYDFLFVVVEDGRRWMIPAGEVDAGFAIKVGGPKYARFEIDPAYWAEEAEESVNA
jgi:hypothetical protein